MNNENLHGDEETVRQLLRDAGERPSIPPDDFAVIRDETRNAWRTRYARSSDSRDGRRRVVLLAATVSAALLLGWWLATRAAVQPSAAPIAAQVESIRGASPLSPGQSLSAGSEITTPAASWLSLRLAGGQSLRLDEGSKVRIVSAERVTLERGGVYLDSAAGRPVTISTVAGDFVPAGTQFELRVAEGSVQLRVREGRVTLEREGSSRSETVKSGEELVVHEDGTLHRGRIGRSDPEWDWTLAAVRIPDIEGRTLQSFLDWISREKGWDVRFESGEIAVLSRETTLHGSVSGMSPDEALSAVMLSSGFSYRISNGTLVVSRP